MARLAVVIAALGLTVPTHGCSRDNPAFGLGLDDGDTTRGVDGTDPTKPSTTRGDDADATRPTQTADDSDASTRADTLGTDVSDSDDSDDSDDGNTTDPSACDLGDEPFTVVLTSEDGVTIQPECGVPRVVRGYAAQGDDDDELWILDCDGACDCPGSTPAISVRFVGLEFSPADALFDHALDCVHLTIGFDDAPSCGAAWVVAEAGEGAAEEPFYFATNSAGPGWGLSVPAPTLGDLLEPCDGSRCNGLAPSGRYAMQIANSDPVEPGEGVVMTLDPYTNGSAPYWVTALFARVDEACTIAIGWSAVLE